MTREYIKLLVSIRSFGHTWINLHEQIAILKKCRGNDYHYYFYHYYYLIDDSQYRVILLLSAKESFFGGRSQKYEHKAQISTTTSVANINYRFTEMIAWIH